MNRSWKSALFVVVAAGTTLALMSASQEPKPAVPQDAKATPQVPVMVTPDDVKWVDASPKFPPGLKMAVLSGDPSKPELFAMRLKAPANYKVAPHFHSTAENLTIVSGTMYVAIGDTFDAAKCKALPAGSFGVVPAKAHHYAYFKEETVVQINSMGPFDLNFVNPADDPTLKAGEKK
jgi:mannose-6-phosphate isomerase-like protein (cupin superfamily)